MSERWSTILKDGVEYPKFEISDLGRIRNKETGKILKTFLVNEYLSVNCYDKTENGKIKKIRFAVHRCVAERYRPNDKPGIKTEVNHIDGTKTNNIYTNLEWCTPKENSEHASRMGLLADQSGENNGCAKLTQEQVDEIRSLYVKWSKEFGINALAKRFKVHPATIHLIVNNKSWIK